MRAAFAMRLRSGKEEGYREAHRAVWPELIAETSQAGIRNLTCFMQGRTVFVYLEADNIEEATMKLKSQPVNSRWDEYMKEFIEPDSIFLEEVFHMD
jgi:L-rhamnose mutarotase